MADYGPDILQSIVGEDWILHRLGLAQHYGSFAPTHTAVLMKPVMFMGFGGPPDPRIVKETPGHNRVGAV
jgi:hypothetical protein